MKIAVFGDIMWNYYLDTHQSLPAECNTKKIGGTLWNVCKAALKHFDTVLAIGAVGAADHGDVVDRMNNMGIQTNLACCLDVSTGACMLIYKRGVRDGILSLRQANMMLPYDVIDIDRILSSDFIFVNGWTMLPESTTSKSLVCVLDSAFRAGIPIIFDVLPHHIQRSEMNPEYIKILEQSSIVICETFPEHKEVDRVVNMQMIYDISKQCRLYILFDWIRSVRVLSKDGKCLTEVPTNYRKGVSTEFLDDLSLGLIGRYYGCA